MIESSDILELADGSSSERSNDGQDDINLGHALLLPVRQATSAVSSHISLQDIAEMTQKEELDAKSLLDADFKDVKTGILEVCPVCGDRVSGYHYGLLTCESCKGFFKRTVQNKKMYSCVDNRNCQIDKSQRKRCPYCRFQKCLSVGMKLEAVRSDRMRGGRNKFGPMYKRDRALKQQAARQFCGMHHSIELPHGANGILELGSPESPEDIKPNSQILQASLTMYAGALSNSVTSNIIPGLIPGSNCLSTTAAAPSSSASLTTSSTASYSVSIATSASSHTGSSSPTSAHPHHLIHTTHQLSHQLLVPISPPNFTQISGHAPTLSHPHSPQPYYPQRHRNQQQPPHHKGNISEQGDSSPPSHHHHQPQHASSHAPSLPDYQQEQPHSRSSQQQRHNNNMMGSTVHERELNYPRVIEALRTFKGSVASGPSERSLLSPLISEIKATMVDESEVKQKMMTFMQNELSQTDIDNPEQFLPVLCRMVDQLLFLVVEWARNSSFFKEIKVEDQMKLLHNSWSEILILDFIYRQIHSVWGRDIIMPNGEVIGFDILDKLGLADVKTKVFELIKKGRELKLDFTEFMCLKFIILLNPDVSGLENRAYVEQSQEKITAALLEYCRLVYPSMGDKYSQLLMRLPEIRLISIRTEDFLYFKHLNNEVPDQTLLTEVLHAKRSG